MKKLSTGQDSTLGNYLQLTVAVMGPDSAAAKFILDKISEDPDGEAGEVLADEGQMINLLIGMG